MFQRSSVATVAVTVSRTASKLLHYSSE